VGAFVDMSISRKAFGRFLGAVCRNLRHFYSIVPKCGPIALGEGDLSFWAGSKVLFDLNLLCLSLNVLSCYGHCCSCCTSDFLGPIRLGSYCCDNFEYDS
jgi:hypothetical protein